MREEEVRDRQVKQGQDDLFERVLVPDYVVAKLPGN
jgi:hypothetical protein